MHHNRSFIFSSGKIATAMVNYFDDITHVNSGNVARLYATVAVELAPRASFGGCFDRREPRPIARRDVYANSASRLQFRRSAGIVRNRKNG